MAYTVTLRTAGPSPSLEEVAEWLTEQGEPFEREGPHTLRLRALPVRVVVPPDGGTQVHIDVTPSAPLVRMVDQIYRMSMRAGADVCLTGHGALSRAALWLSLADEQDRRRLSAAFAAAEEQGKRDEVVKRLWGVIGELAPGKDVRWDAARGRIVELKEVGVPEGIPLEEAQWHDADVSLGDVVPVPVEEPLHIVAYRWLSEAHPGLIEP